MNDNPLNFLRNHFPAPRLGSWGRLAASLTLTTLFVWLFSSFCSAADPGTDFDAANKLYEQGHFQEAAAQYEKLISAGHVSSAVLFNLGNSYFKAGELGRAVAAYRSAQKLEPRDPDVRANLAFARNQVKGNALILPRWRAWLGRLTLNEWTLLAATVFWVWLLVLAVRQWRPSLKPALRALTIAVAIVLLGSVAALAAAIQTAKGLHLAVITVPEARVHYGPLDASPTGFTLHDGAEVRILDQKEQWYQVTLDPKRIGWVRKEQLLLENQG